MNKLPQDYEQICFRFLAADLSISEFESFIYETSDLEQYFSKDDYLELISLDYRDIENTLTAQDILKKHINLKDFEIWRLKFILNCIINKEKGYGSCIAFLNDLYSGGYYFLRLFLFDWIDLSDRSFDSLSIEDLDKKSESSYPKIINKAQHVIDLIETGKISIEAPTDNDTNNDIYHYTDHRTEDERKITDTDYANKYW